MIKVDVREALERDNVEELSITIPAASISCGNLLENCKMLLCITDDRKYGLKQNGVFIHQTEKIPDGESLELALIPYDDQEE